jgi:hypothetical protein
LASVFPKIIVGFKPNRKISEIHKASLTRIKFEEYGNGDKGHVSGELSLMTADLDVILACDPATRLLSAAKQFFIGIRRIQGHPFLSISDKDGPSTGKSARETLIQLCMRQINWL